MTETLTLEKIIAFLKVDLIFACCWPLPMKATKFQKIRDKIFRSLCCLNSIIMSISLIYTVIKKYDMFVVMKVSLELTAFLQVPIQIILFTLQSDRLQIIIYEMENYIQQAKSEERNIFQRYINKCKLFYGTTLCLITMTAIIMWFGPLLMVQPFPIEVEYPFNVNKQPLRIIIYLHHVMAVYQSCVQVCSNVFVALLLWFIAARFEILSHKFQKITSISEFIICIQLHQRLLRYAKDVTMTVRYIALSTVGFSSIAVIFSGLTFLTQQTLTMKTQCFAISTSALIEVFICAWPADYLLRTSNDIGHAGYESSWYNKEISSWYNKEISLQKNLLYTVSRCQHPVTLTVPCLLPSLSLNYYASFLSTTFSYFTTFRAMLAKEDEMQM